MDPSNPTTMLVPLGGILLILVAVWLTGGAKRGRLDAATAARRIAEDQPGIAVHDLSIGIDGLTALASVAGAATLAAAFVAGDKIVVRRLAPGDIVRIDRRPRDGNVRLVVDTDDFSHGRLEITLPALEAAAWEERLATLAAPANAARPIAPAGAA